MVIAKYYAKQVIMGRPRDLEVVEPSRVAVKGWPAARLELKALPRIYFGAFKGKLTRQVHCVVECGIVERTWE